MAKDTTIQCPKCSAEFRLTESLAAPMLAKIKSDYEQKLTDKDQAVQKREDVLRSKEEMLQKERTQLDEQIQSRLQSERSKIASEESRKARQLMNDELDESKKRLIELKELLESKDSKLAEAQKIQAEVLRKERELEDAKREIDLTIEKRVNAEIGKTRKSAKKEAEDELKMKVAEKEQTIVSMQKQIEELKRKSEQGSQQLQGEVLELHLEEQLAANFPTDDINPVPKGEHGGDIIQTVIAQNGRSCGKLLWETKRTKNWSDGWLIKLREDQRAAKADLSIIVSSVLPKEIDLFDFVDGIWIAHPKSAMPLAVALRATLMEVHAARKASEGQQSKMELIYHYLTGANFRQRVEALVEASSTMQDDLNKERAVITKQWAKREKQIAQIMMSTVGMWGDLQGIAGKTLAEIQGINLELVAASIEPDSENN